MPTGSSAGTRKVSKALSGAVPQGSTKAGVGLQSERAKVRS